MSYYDCEEFDISVLKGKTLSEVVVSGYPVDNDAGEIRFITSDGETYILYHEQDCCESVYIESIVGDTSDLVGTPILLVE